MQPKVLKDCIEILKRVQAEKRGTQEAGLIAELNEVIVILQRLDEEADESGEAVVAEPVKRRVLELILRIVQATTNLAEVIYRFINER
jgi:hypothetical protein